jgi:hypothetical protein
MGLVNWDNNYPHHFYQYDPINNIWNLKTNCPDFSLGCVGFAIGNYGYVALGYWYNNANGANFNDVWQYNPVTDTWMQKANFPGAGRGFAFSFTIGDKGYIGAGDTVHYYNIQQPYFVNVSDLWEYDSNTDIWIQKASFPENYVGSGTNFVIDSKAYICKDTSEFWVYDPSINAWNQLPNISNLGNQFDVGFSIDNNGYVYSSNTDTINKFWEYSPTTGINQISNPIKTTLYPNPFSITATLAINGVETQLITSLQIFNLIGQEVKTIPIINQKEIIINRDNLADGMYFYKIIGNNNETIAVGKMVIQ